MPHRPVLLGIVGDSAAGKTTITRGITGLLGADRVTTFSVDDYHRYNRVERKVLGITPLHPDCNYTDIMEQHLRLIATGEPILKPVYNHSTGDFDPPEYVYPKKFVIVDGLLAFHTQAMRDCFHVKVFLDPPEELRHRWKIKRDCAKRGYRPEDVMKELAQRAADSAAYIRPQGNAADIVVRFYPGQRPADPQRLNVRLTLRSTLPHPDLRCVVAEQDSAAVPLALEPGRDDGRSAGVVEIDGRATADQVAAIESALWAQQPELERLPPDQIGYFVDGFEERRSYSLGIAQLLLTYHLLMARFQKEKMGKRTEEQLLTTLKESAAT
jgi:phosphoribulokinase